jgi:hypothetical protein
MGLYAGFMGFIPGLSFYAGFALINAESMTHSSYDKTYSEEWKWCDGGLTMDQYPHEHPLTSTLIFIIGLVVVAVLVFIFVK